MPLEVRSDLYGFRLLIQISNSRLKFTQHYSEFQWLGVMKLEYRPLYFYINSNLMGH